MAPLHEYPPDDHPAKRKADAIEQAVPSVNLKNVAPYDPSDVESAPRSATASSDWAILDDGRRLIYELVEEPFAESQTSLAKRLVQRAKDDLFNETLTEITVCLSGNMGVGKSATLNSILQAGNIARSEDRGASCTLASNIFTGPRAGQQNVFEAEVVFFSAQERHEILQAYLRDYYRAFTEPLHDEEGNKVGADDDINPTIKHDVVKAVYSLFRDQKECASKRAVRDFLEEARDEDDARILSKLIEWSDNLIRRVTSSNGTRVVGAATPGELTTALTEYTVEVDEEDSDDFRCSLWPLVSLVTFHFEDPLFKHGIRILDTPGASDLNRTRRRSAQTYARWRTHALIVTDAARAQDDPSVGKQVRLMKARGRNRVIIVSPKSDLIGSSTLPAGSKRAKEIVKQLRKRHSDLEDQAAAIDESINACEDETNNEVKMARLNKEKRMLEVLVKQADNAEKAHRIQMRSENNKTALQEKLRDYSDEPIPVLSVSNHCYSQHLAGYPPKRAPTLSVEETNVPELRRILSAFPNEARLNEARYMQQTIIPNLLARLRLFTSRTAGERKAEIEVHIKKPSKAIWSVVHEVVGDLESRATKIVIRPLESSKREWTAAVSVLCDAWNKAFPPGTHLALMKRNGSRKGNKKNPAINMNQELMSVNAVKVSDAFEALTRSFITMQEALMEDTRRLFENMVKELRGDANAFFDDLEPFINFISTGKARLFDVTRDICSEALDGLDQIRVRAVFANDNAYLVNSMIPVYDRIRLIKSGAKDEQGIKCNSPACGWPTYRKEMFKTAVLKPNGIWASVCKGIEADIRQLLKDEEERLGNALAAIFQDFHTAFVDMYEAGGSDVPDEKVQIKLAENLEKAEQHLNGPMQQAYQQLRRNFL